MILRIKHNMKSKMRIRILGFRCHIDSEYTIHDGNITLIRGPSGCGKSTIFSAIYWCLYGKLRNVFNLNDTTRCSVTVEFAQYTIIRQKKPEHLSITFQDRTVYEGDVAQKVIESMFGTKELWQTCSYIMQGEKCSLLSGSNTERMDLLNALSFNTDDPEQFIERIDTEIKHVNTKIELAKQQYEPECIKFTHDLEKNPVNDGDLIDDEMLSQHKNTLISLKSEYEFLRGKIHEQQKLKGALTAFNESLLSITSRLDSIPLTSEDDLKNLKDCISEKEQLMKLLLLKHEADNNSKSHKLKYDNLLSTLQQKYPQNLDTLKPFLNEKTLWEFTDQERKYQENFNKCKTLGISYNIDIVQTEIKTKQEEQEFLLTLNQKLIMSKNINNLEGQANQYRKYLSDLSAQISQSNFEIQTLNSQLVEEPSLQTINEEKEIAYNDYQKLLKLTEILSCPHCGGSVKYSDKQLLTSDLCPVTPEQLQMAYTKFNNLQLQYKQAQGIISNQNSIKLKLQQAKLTLEKYNTVYSEKSEVLDKYLAQISELKTPDLNAFVSQYGNITEQQAAAKILDIRTKLNVLSSIQFFNLPPVSSDIISLYLQLNTLHDNMLKSQQESAKYAHLVQSLDCVKLECQHLHSQYSLQFKHFTTRQELLKQQLDLQTKIQNIFIDPSFQSRFDTVQTDISHLTTIISQAEYAISMVQRRDSLQKLHDTLTDSINDLTALLKLRQTAIDVECKQLQCIVNSINDSIAEFLTLLFDDPITVTLSLYRTLKSDKRTKPSVNLNIVYRGCEFDSISQLSGGEADRISLALIISLCRVSFSPILLLDECFSSLDSNLRELCIKTIRSFLPKTKTVLCISHEDIDGHYDDVISFN